MYTLVVKNKMTQLVNPLEVLKSLSEATSMLIKKISESVVSVKAQMSRGTGVVLTKTATSSPATMSSKDAAQSKSGKEKKPSTQKSLEQTHTTT